MPRLPRRIASDLSAKLRSPETAAAVAGLESRLTRRRREQKMSSGAFRGMHVVVYCGYVADDVAKVRVRVVEVPELPGDSRIPYWETAQSNLRRHAALPMVGVEVELSIGTHSAREMTDSHGFANFTLAVPKLTVGWHDVHAVTTPLDSGETAAGSWSFYPLLRQFLEINEFPSGPMFLTDWGPTERYLRRSGAEHKRAAIRRLLQAYPQMRFVLIGDSGQRDPITYADMAAEFAGRVELILIRQVGADDDERNVAVRDHAEAMRAQGIPLHLVADAAEAATLARTAGLCDDHTLDEIDAALN